MEPSELEAQSVLDLFLFEDIDNNNNFHEDDWSITWEGDNFVLLHHDTGKLFSFCVRIEPHEWDYSQAVKDQEWHHDYDLENFDRKN